VAPHRGIGGADSIDDLDLLRHGTMPALLGGVRAPATLGSFLRIAHNLLRAAGSLASMAYARARGPHCAAI
jgi:hypothetical protein